MVRYTLAVSGPPRSLDERMDVEEKIVDIFHGEQLDEHFLANINAQGLVPVLVADGSEHAIPDSLTITRYIAERYPQLRPIKYKDRLEDLLVKLHALNYFSLSFGTRPHVADSLLADIDDRMNRVISDQYREALEYKRQYTLENKWKGVKQHEIEHNEVKARSLMNEFDGLLSPNKDWLFGLDQPTALDAHLVIFLARMRDVGRAALLTGRLLDYLDSAAETQEFKQVMQGRVTMVAA